MTDEPYERPANYPPLTAEDIEAWDGHEEAFPQTKEAVNALSLALFGHPIKRVARPEIRG